MLAQMTGVALDLDVGDDRSALGRGWPPIVPLAAVALLYLVTARTASLWTLGVGGAQPFWPATGVILGAALVLPRRLRRSAVIGGLLGEAVNLRFFLDVSVSDLVAELIATSVLLVVVVLGLQRLFAQTTRVDYAWRAILALVICLIGAGLGALVVVAWNRPDDLLSELISYTIAEGLGGFVVGSMILNGRVRWLDGAHPRDRPVELAVILTALVAVTVVMFGAGRPAAPLTIAILLIAAIRFGTPIAEPAALGVIVYACLRTGQGAGPFVLDGSDGLRWLQAYNATIVLVAVEGGRQARERLYSERWKDALLQALPDVVVVADIDQPRVATHVNANVATTDADAVIASRVPELLMELDRPRPDHSPLRAVDTIHQSDGTSNVIDVITTRLDSTHSISVARDITELVEADRGRRRAEDRWRQLAATAAEGLVELDRDLCVVFASDRFAEILETSPDQLVGRLLADQFTPDEWRRLSRNRAIANAEGRFIFEEYFRRRTGELVWVVLSSHTLWADDGSFDGAIMFAADTTEFHRTAEARDLAELRLASVEQLERRRIARSLHDGPLQTLVALSYQLNALTNGAEVAPGKLESMALDCVRLLRGSLSDLVPPEVAEGQMVQALRSVIDRFATVDGPEVRLADRTVSPIDPDVASNLFRIAREAIANALLHAQAAHIDVEITDDGAAIELVVTDDGIGIGIDQMAFDDGHLGLRSMHERAADLGGNCEISLADPHGTHVRVRLPRNPLHRVSSGDSEAAATDAESVDG